MLIHHFSKATASRPIYLANLSIDDELDLNTMETLLDDMKQNKEYSNV